jgi:hypothetical protein
MRVGVTAVAVVFLLDRFASPALLQVPERRASWAGWDGFVGVAISLVEDDQATAGDVVRPRPLVADRNLRLRGGGRG